MGARGQIRKLCAEKRSGSRANIQGYFVRWHKIPNFKNLPNDAWSQLKRRFHSRHGNWDLISRHSLYRCYDAKNEAWRAISEMGSHVPIEGMLTSWLVALHCKFPQPDPPQPRLPLRHDLGMILARFCNRYLRAGCKLSLSDCGTVSRVRDY